MRSLKHWECHLFSGTRYVGGWQDFWGHATSPSGQYCRRIDIYVGNPPAIVLGKTEHQDFSCKDHSSEYVGLETALRAAEIN